MSARRGPPRTPTQQPGVAVDADGGPVVDPTANVLSLVQAAVQRLDDLRGGDTNHLLSLLSAEGRRLDDLRIAESERVDEQLKVRTEYTDKLAAAEAKRIDAIRAVDVAAVAVASERASQQASVLANQVAASAEALRALVASTANTVAQQLQTVSTQFTERLAALEKSSYEGKGRQALADPALAELVSEMRRVVLTQSSAGGKSQGLSAAWGFIVGAAGLAAAVVAVVAALLR